MIAESELLRHKWWHRFLSRQIGAWQEQGVNKSENLYAVIQRAVFYCPICRADFHEGGPIRHQINNAIGKPPSLSAVPANNNVVELQQWPPVED